MAKDPQKIFAGFLVGVYKMAEMRKLLQEHGASPAFLDEMLGEILGKLRDSHLRRNIRDGPYTPREAKEEFFELLRNCQHKKKQKKGGKSATSASK